MFSDLTFDESVNLNASELIGMRVYATEADIAGKTQIAAGGENEWDDIGEINEILLTCDGDVQAVIIGMGGFLGMGERPVAVMMDELQIVRSDDGSDVRVYIDSSQDALEQLPMYDS